MDGFVIVGGVGIGAHCCVLVVNDTNKWARHEVGIVFIPAVCGTLIL